MPPKTRRTIALGLFSRFVVDTTAQMFYAFLPILAAGIGVTPIVFGRLLSIRAAPGLLTPLFGNFAERRGYRNALPLTLICGSLGALLLLIQTKSLLIPTLAMFVLGIGIMPFQPLLAAYTSEAIPAQHRARGMGIIEYGWALSSIFGVYGIGRLIAVSGWRLPILIIAIALGLLALLMARLLRNQPDLDDTPPIPLRDQFRITENRQQAFAGIAIQTILVFAALHLFISYSIWLVETHGFDAIRLGSVVLTFGFVDLAGSGSVSLFLDRLGRRNALMLTNGLAGLTLLALGFANSVGLVTALAVLFLGRFFFEAAIVSNLITVSEASPHQRSRVMSSVGFLTTIAQALAGITGPLAFRMFGVNGLGIPAGVGFLIAGFLAWRFLTPSSQ